MRTNWIRRALPATIAALALLATTATAAPARATPTADGWTGTWATAAQRPSTPPWSGGNWSEAGFADQSLRQIIRTTTSGSTLRVRVSNRFGERPLRITSATIGRAGDGAAVSKGSLRRLSFGGHAVPAGAERVSEPVRLATAPLERLAITLYLATPTGPATYHEAGLTTAYRASGDHSADPSGAAFTETSQSSYLLTGVEVTAGRSVATTGRRGAVVTFGDSITDGYGSTLDAYNRYPDELAERLAATGRPTAVLNTGIGGNRVLSDSPCLGDSALTRFRRDALDRPGVRTVIVLEGINDIGAATFPPDPDCIGTAPAVTAEDLIAGHRALIQAARRRGVQIIGATLTPVKGSPYYSERNEAVRDALNHWIRTSGEYDAVADFDRAVANPADPDALLPAFDSGDGLHPGDAGLRAMAATVRL